jgi:dCMP deaminase
MSQPSIQRWALNLAFETAERATCPRRKVGCVLLDSRGRVLATGYNGVPSGFGHCIDTPCAGVTEPDGCLATHAEINALIQCSDPDAVHFAVVTCYPCFRCLKALLNTGMKELVFSEYYAGYQQTFWMLKERSIRTHYIMRNQNGKS